MKYLLILLCLFLFNCGRDIIQDDTITEILPTQTEPQSKEPENNPSTDLPSNNVPAETPLIPKPTINCPIGLQQDVPNWFNYEKWQRLNPDYSSSDFYLYIDKSNGTWKLQNEEDLDNIELVACGLFLNFDYLKDYTSGKMGYGTLDIFYKSLTEDINWTCWYGYYYNEPNANPYVPKNESRVMLNCGDSDDLFDTEISYYFRSFGF
jgi:hypothetical protein